MRCFECGCTAYWLPTLVLPPIGYAYAEPMEMEVEARFCDACRKFFDLRQCLLDVRDDIIEKYETEGRLPPDYARARVKWIWRN